MNFVEIAKKIATEAHHGRYRRPGNSLYITHPAAVAKSLEGSSDEVIATAWLHDVLEDAVVTTVVLLAAGIPVAVVEAVEALTKDDGMDYDSYIRRVMRNPIARKVKVADILHNLSGMPTPRQVARYARALEVLLQPQDAEIQRPTRTLTRDVGKKVKHLADVLEHGGNVHYDLVGFVNDLLADIAHLQAEVAWLEDRLVKAGLLVTRQAAPPVKDQAGPRLKKGDLVELDCGYHGILDMKVCRLLSDPIKNKPLFPDDTQDVYSASVELVSTGEVFTAQLPASDVVQPET